ncbi:MAG: hypothetical protein EOM62_15865 [Bacteroidia bacterium]|nr:hypothetical protein [Bacteroidia bacterium]
MYLAELYASQQGESSLEHDIAVEEKQSAGPGAFYDMRINFINTTRYRNDIELFQFNPDASSFGKGGATITSAQLLDEKGRTLSWIVGGENVTLKVTCNANVDLFSPIVGFLVNDRLGQPLFGDNTYNFSKNSPLCLVSGDTFEASFTFFMPILPFGDYSVTLAIAEGTQLEHVQHHWMHEALLFKSHSSSVSTGLIGIPMGKIIFNKK